MTIVAFTLNLPWTIIALVAAIVSVPRQIAFDTQRLALIFRVRSLWWAEWMPAKKGIRGTALGHVVLLSPKEMNKDLEHELIHVEQSIREPFIHFFLYNIELMRKGYRQNKYEVEAYDRTGSVYLEE